MNKICNREMLVVYVWDTGVFKKSTSSETHFVRQSTKTALSSPRSVFALVSNVDMWNEVDLLVFSTKLSVTLMRIGSSSVVAGFNPMPSKCEMSRCFYLVSSLFKLST